MKTRTACLLTGTLIVLFAVATWLHVAFRKPALETAGAEAPQRATMRPGPLTDVARARPANMTVPSRRPRALDLAPQVEDSQVEDPSAEAHPPAKPQFILPRDLDFDPQSPPQWTEVIAMPNLNPVPPDPNVEPPLHVNPERSR